MGILSFFQKKKIEKKGIKGFNNLDLLNLYGARDRSYSIFNLGSLTSTDYLKLYTGWAYSCINVISDTASSVDYHFVQKKGSDKIIDNKILELITPELIKSIASYLQISGSCYILKEMFGGKVDKLTVLRPDMMQLVDDILPDTPYCYTDGMGRTYYYREDEIIDIDLFNPFTHSPKKSKGISPMGAVALQMEMDKLSILNNQVLLKNGANPNGALTTEKSLTKQQIMELKEKWNMQYGGVENAGSTVFLPDGLTFVPISISPKELDFIESRRFTMDEVFTVFGVPKEVLGFLNNANLASSKVAETLFRKGKIKPLLRLIESRLNKQLFNGIGYFEFINIVPTDTDEARLNFQTGGITLNEFRGKIGQKPLKEGDKLNIMDGQLTDISFIKEDKKSLTVPEQIIKKSYLKNIKGTDEWMEGIIDKRNKRLEDLDERLKDAIKKVWNIQKQDLIKYIKSEKTEKGIKSVEDFFDEDKYYGLYLLYTQDIFKGLILTEGQKALEDFGISGIFNPGDSQLGKFLKINTRLWAQSVDETSLKLFETAMKKAEDLGLGINQMVTEINKLYLGYEKDRIESIVRTETIRAGTEGQLMAWEQSGVVDSKKWFTAKNDRVCKSCRPMHGKIIGLKEAFFKKGETDDGGLVVGYGDMMGPPEHIRCVCGLSPIITK